MYFYFSFFGSVELEMTPPGDWRSLLERWEKRGGQERPIWSFLTLIGGAKTRYIVDLGSDGTTTAVAAVRPRRQCAILLVRNSLAGWAEAAIVRWPLRFEAPAAIAGACCAPRYGLKRGALPPEATVVDVD